MTTTLTVTTKNPCLWRRTGAYTFCYFPGISSEGVRTIDAAWKWLEDSELCVGSQLKPFGHAMAWIMFNANQSQIGFFRHTLISILSRTVDAELCVFCPHVLLHCSIPVVASTLSEALRTAYPTPCSALFQYQIKMTRWCGFEAQPWPTTPGVCCGKSPHELGAERG
jgi:hypothetical protein